MYAGKMYNNKKHLKDKMKLLFGANTLNVILSSLFFMIGFTKKEEKLLKDNAEFRYRYKGKRCFILGNGPSVRTMDLSLLEKEVVFTVNQFSKTEMYKKIKPNFHIWADERFYDIDAENDCDNEILSDMKAAKLTDLTPIVFYKTSAKNMIEKYGLKDLLNIHYYSDKLTFDDKYKKNPDMCKLIPWFPTVVQYAVFFAIYMGFSEIYLLGCECTGILNYIKERDKKSSDLQYAYSYELNEKEQQNFRKAAVTWNSANVFKSHYNVLLYYELLRY